MTHLNVFPRARDFCVSTSVSAYICPVVMHHGHRSRPGQVCTSSVKSAPFMTYVQWLGFVCWIQLCDGSILLGTAIVLLKGGKQGNFWIVSCEELRFWGPTSTKEFTQGNVPMVRKGRFKFAEVTCFTSGKLSDACRQRICLKKIPEKALTYVRSFTSTALTLSRLSSSYWLYGASISCSSKNHYNMKHWKRKKERKKGNKNNRWGFFPYVMDFPSYSSLFIGISTWWSKL